jgi:hypothetical protein
MESAGLFDEPPRRRWWLLSKALEAAPLDEALRLAQAAEDFLTGRPEGNSADRPNCWTPTNQQ